MTTTKKKIELDQYGEEALRLLADTKTSFFLTGNGGTGKTFLINHFLNENKLLPKEKQKKVQMLATTGAAATLYDFGETYHSFFKIFGETLGKADRDQKAIMRHFDTYIIDEASMISASQFDLIDKRLRLVTKKDELFGGKQIIFVGHLFQASPVVTDNTKQQYFEATGKKYDEVYNSIFFFDAKNFNEDVFKIIELKKTHRTTDKRLQTYLKNLMLGENLEGVCKYFNQNLVDQSQVDHDKAVYIANTNNKVNKYNKKKLQELVREGATLYNSKAYYSNWDLDSWGKLTNKPAPENIEYCVGSRVMFNKNESMFKNGTMGTVTKIITKFDPGRQKDFENVHVLIDGMKDSIVVEPAVWNKYETNIDRAEEGSGNEDVITHEIVGYYYQLPFQLGWGITAHKSQGKTFDKIICDIGKIYYKDDSDQWISKAVDHIVYVALSRATSYEGIQVIQKLTPDAISVNEDVKRVCNSLIK